MKFLLANFFFSSPYGVDPFDLGAALAFAAALAEALAFGFGGDFLALLFDLAAFSTLFSSTSLIHK